MKKRNKKQQDKIQKITLKRAQYEKSRKLAFKAAKAKAAAAPEATASETV